MKFVSDCLTGKDNLSFVFFHLTAGREGLGESSILLGSP